MRSYKVLLVSLLTALAIAGCGGQDTIPATDAADAADEGASTSGADREGLGGFEALDGDSSPSGAAPAGLMDQLIVYFEFDSSDIRPDFNDMLTMHGQYLASNPNAQLRLEGHADERGSREYNIGLGERRAQAVRRILMLQGATAGQLSTVSYGEERPAAVGSDEETYTLNRRVELVYR